MDSSILVITISIYFQVFLLHVSSFAVIGIWVPYEDANQYCIDECDSTLPILYDNQTYHQFLHYLRTEVGERYTTWIGLSNITGDGFEWVDGGDYSFGSDISGGVYPWANGEPNGYRDPSKDYRQQKCTVMRHWNPQNDLWDDFDCESNWHVVCNSCYKQAYVLIQSKFKYLDANRYCNNHCGSALASVKNRVWNYQAIYIAETLHIQHTSDDGIWIGLNQIGIYPYWNWMVDGTNRNWAWDNNYPWIPNNPNYSDVDTCAQMSDHNGEQLWSNINCEDEKSSICHSCDGQLNKYIYVYNDGNYRYDQAQEQCQILFGTDLASIHSDRDLHEAQLLCNATQTIDRSCFVGLNDLNNDTIWEWIDGTTFDYGTTLGEYPWFEGEPNNPLREHCVELRHQFDFLWNNIRCVGGNNRNFICNAPSKLYNFDNGLLIIPLISNFPTVTSSTTTARICNFRSELIPIEKAESRGLRRLRQECCPDSSHYYSDI